MFFELFLKIIFTTIFTTRKRSLGQGNIFTSVCQEFCSQGGGAWSQGGASSGGAWSRGVCSGGVCFGGCLVLGGVCSQGGAWSWGVLLPGGSARGGGVLGGDPPGRLLPRAVCILLECILVRDPNKVNEQHSPLALLGWLMFKDSQHIFQVSVHNLWIRKTVFDLNTSNVCSHWYVPSSLLHLESFLQ